MIGFYLIKINSWRQWLLICFPGKRMNPLIKIWISLFKQTMTLNIKNLQMNIRHLFYLILKIDTFIKWIGISRNLANRLYVILLICIKRGGNSNFTINDTCDYVFRVLTGNNRFINCNRVCTWIQMMLQLKG